MGRLNHSILRMVLVSWLLSQNGCLLLARQVYNQVDDRRAEQALGLGAEERASPVDVASLPAGIRVMRDIAYGSNALQCFDVYAPAQAKGAPVILMVHGGGWFRGDKAMRNVVENKVKQWVARGFIVVSVNNRLQPAADPIEQAKDVARALAVAQDKAASWGGDRNKFILMGHSAGAHLIALLSVSPTIIGNAGAAAWLGSILLDSAALDVSRIMQARHMGLYDRAFGSDPARWKAASPYDVVTQGVPPILAVCSSRRRESCAQATRFVAKATSFGTHAAVLSEDLSHEEINERLGTAGAYTDAVEAFMRSLDPVVAGLLAGAPSKSAQVTPNKN